MKGRGPVSSCVGRIIDACVPTPRACGRKEDAISVRAFYLITIDPVLPFVYELVDSALATEKRREGFNIGSPLELQHIVCHFQATLNLSGIRTFPPVF